MWDVFFFDGWKTIFRVGIAVLKHVKGALMSMSLEEVSKYFRAGEHVKEFVLREEMLIKCALRIKLTNRELRRLESAYISSALLKIAAGEPTAAVVDERTVISLRKTMHDLETPTKLDVSVLRARIEYGS